MIFVNPVVKCLSIFCVIIATWLLVTGPQNFLSAYKLFRKKHLKYEKESLGRIYELWIICVNNM